jgi:hypothetical protein|tara:strand:+ start:255 stop:416 length:162 start_codon:yes stop_codon:yes gene_type:complete
MTKEEFVAAIAAKRTEEYVKEVLEDMTEEDLYCTTVIQVDEEEKGHNMDDFHY